MKAAVVTMPVQAGACERNYRYMEAQIQRAATDGADMIIFPQNAVTGYLLGDLWLDASFCEYADSFNDKITALSEKIAIVWGNIKYRSCCRFNAAFYAYRGQTHMRVKKNRDDFLYQDSRYFKEHAINSAIELDDYVMALNFGEERQIADININLDARPYMKKEVLHIKGTTIYVNSIGMDALGKNVVIYPGGSQVVVSHRLIYQAPYGKEDYALVDLDQKGEIIPKKAELLDMLLLGIRTYDTQVFQGRMPWIIGMSGGLDSSVSAALLQMALGKERVIAYNMATRHNGKQTISNAGKEAEKLGIRYREGAIETLVNASVDNVLEFEQGTQEWDPLVKENIQARVRGHLLSTFASIHGGVVVNNGNKVEVALGYCTLYGDAIGALGLLGDLTKTDLFELARAINNSCNDEIIPVNLLPQVEGENITWEMPPSAELSQGQRDPMKWFYHDALVEHLGMDWTLSDFMNSYLDGSIYQSDLGKWIRYYGLDDPKAFIEDLSWFLKLRKRNGFKRIQTPPILTLSRNAYGNPIVEAQLQEDQQVFQEYSSYILNKEHIMKKGNSL